MILFNHQTRAVEMLRENPRYYLCWACGVGKTIGVLAACADRPMPTLVLAPLSTLETAWARDAAHFPTLKVCIVRGSASRQRALIQRANASLFITNYDAFRTRVNLYEMAGIRRLVVDEAVKIKNPNAAITKKAIAFADRMESVILLSGYPAPQGPQDWWSQMRACDVRCLGRAFWSFAYRYTTPVKQRLRDGREFIARFSQSAAQADSLAAQLKPWVWSLSKSECLDLPAQTDEVRDVDLSADESAAYAGVRDQLRLIVADGLHNGHVRVKAEAALIKLRQITGGGVLTEGAAVEYREQAKLAELLSVVEGLHPSESLLVWCEFRGEIHRVHNVLTRYGGVLTLFGDNSDKAGETVEAFRSGKYRFLVANPATAGHGTNGLQDRCSYAVFYSYGFNSDQHVQARDRIHRSGMRDRSATYIYLRARGTVDEAALRVLRGKQKRAFTMLDALREACGEQEKVHA